MLRKWIGVLLFLSSMSTLANTFLSDASDLWWNENESGWGVTVSHQREIVFLTFFIYGPDGRAIWYTAQGSYLRTDAQGAYIFSGPMYQVNGSWFGTVFNPTIVSPRAVGTMTFTLNFLNSATLAYTIDGVSVTKALTRQTFRANDLTGEYIGAIKQIQSGCRSPYTNGNFNTGVDISITHNTNSFKMSVRQANGNSCNYVGNYTQSGRLGRSQGTYTCPGGLSGTYDAFEIEASLSGLLGRYVGGDNFCNTVTGRFGSMRK